MKTWGRILLVLGVGTTILIHQNSDILGGNRKPLNQGQVNQPTLSITKKQSHEPKDGDRFNTSSTCNEFHRRILQNGFATSICNGRYFDFSICYHPTLKARPLLKAIHLIINAANNQQFFTTVCIRFYIIHRLASYKLSTQLETT